MKFLYSFFIFFPLYLFSQANQFSIEANYFYGSILPHSPKISHLITSMPQGALLSFNKKTFGNKAWESWYNYPDYGLSFQYQDNNNKILGNLYGIYAHMNFYFFKRNLQFRVAQGIAYSTNPYNIDTNFMNVAYGSRIMPSTYFYLAYHKPNLFKNVGAQIGINFVHHSDANIKSPNTSTNTIALTFGLNYSFAKNDSVKYIGHAKSKLDNKFHYNLFYRTGWCESDVPNSGAKPFYVASFYIDKQISAKSGFQLGTDVFWMTYLKEYIKYDASVYYEENRNPNADYRRIGLFAGYELFLDKLVVDLQAGAYVYNPSHKQGEVYQRIGLRYAVANNIYTGISLKTHLAQAEALEISLGYRL